MASNSAAGVVRTNGTTVVVQPRLGLLFILFILIFSCVAIFVAFVGRDLWLEMQRPTQQLSLETSAPVSAQEQIIETKIASYDKRADDLEKLISFLIGLSVLYTLALGVTSYLGLQQTLQQAQVTADKVETIRSKAEEELEKSNNRAAEKAAEIVRGIRDEYPMFGFMDVSIRRITEDLLKLLPFIGWSDRLYQRLTKQQKQKILFYEKTVAGFEFFDLLSIRRDVSKIFDGLGNFYALKFQSEAPNNSPEDLERCRFYLYRAKETDRENIAPWNDLAFVALVLESPSDRSEVRECCARSLEVDPKQQRARYNLAAVEHFDRHFGKAERLLTEALELERWQEDRFPKRIHNLYYNRACARSRLADDTTIDPSRRDRLLEEAFDDIKEACKQPEFWDEEDRDVFKTDREPGGDIHLVSEKYKVEIEELASRLSLVR